MNSKTVGERLMRPWLWLLVVIGIAGIVFFFAKFNESFPSASIDLRFNRNQINVKAREWAQRVGYDTKDSISSTVFSYADDEKTFLEYELGQSEANKLMRTEIPIWYWVTRFCKEKQIEEISVGISPTGKLDYFTWSIPNDKELPVVSHSEAEKRCRTFVESVVGQSLANTKLVNDAEDKQLHRTDHYFTWEDQSREFKGGRLRTYVYISGNIITDYSQYLHVPETFQRKFAEIRSYNDLLKQISSVVYVVLSSAISFVFIWAFASGRIRWKLAAIAGVIGFLMTLLNWVDALPGVVSRYSTTMTFQQYMTNSVVGLLFSSVYVVIACVVFVGALEPVYRMMFPEKVAVEKMFTAAGLRSRSVFRSLVAGLSVFGLHTAYVVAFYLIGQKFGFWSPLEIRETSILSGLLPAWSAIDVGISASTTEELMYRVLGLALFQKLTRNFWAANFLQAVAWAFMHSDYPQEPAYARGVELTIGGFFYGFILKQFGLLACVLAHYTYDAFLGVTPLFSSHSAVDFIWALIAVAPGVVALIISGYLMSRRGINNDEEALANSTLDAPRHSEPVEQAAPVSFRYHPLSGSVVGVLLCGTIVAGLAMALIQDRTVGKLNVVKASRSQVLSNAATYLAKDGINPQGMTRVAYMTDDSDSTQMQYVFEKQKYERTKALAEKVEPRLVWKVRFFKPLNAEEFVVTLAPDGKPLYHSRIEMEDAPGDRPDQPAAKAMVERFLNKEHPEYHYEYDDATRHERKARIDYDFTYRVPDLKVGDADFRVRTGTVGGDVSGFSRSWQIPDAWLFERSMQSWYQQAFTIVRGGCALVMALAALWWVIGLIRSGYIRWRLSVWLACIAAAGAVLLSMNNSPIFLWSYDTEVQFNTFVMKQLVSNLIYILSSAASVGLFSAIAIAAYRQMFPNLPPASMFKAAFPWKQPITEGTRRLWFDGIAAAYLFSPCAAGVFYLLQVGESLTSPEVRVLPASSIRGMTDHLSPALGEFLSALQSGFGTLFSVVVLAAIFRKYFGWSLKKMAIFVVLTSVIMSSGERYWQDYSWSVASSCVFAVMAYLYIVRVARLNVLAYLLTGYFGVLASAVITLWRQGLDVYYPDIAVLITFLLAPLAFALWLKFGTRGTGPIASSISSSPPPSA